MLRRILLPALLALSACFDLDPGDTDGGTGTGGGSGGGTGGSTGTGGGSGSTVCKYNLADIDQDTTWSGDLTVDCAVIVRTEVTLTIAAGTHLKLGKGSFQVQGSLVVAGTAAAPVTVARAGAEPWGPIELQDTFGAHTYTLQHVTFTGGGEAVAVETSTSMGAVLVHRSPGTPLLVQDVTVDGASGVGLVMQDSGFAAGSSGLVVKNSGSYPLYVGFEHLGSVPSGTYAGNAKNAVLTGTAWRAPYSDPSRITTTSTIRKLDVPYVVGTGKYQTKLMVSTVQSGQPTFGAIPLVTFEPGVELRFTRVTGTNAVQSGLNVDSSPDNGTWKPLGALRAVGTAAAPIVFTSAEATPAAGDWMGVSLEELDSRTQLDHVEIGYAGANAGALGACPTGAPSTGSPWDGDAALQIFMNVGAPAASVLTNSVLHDSAGGGVYRAFSEGTPDFTATNTFTNIAWCKQTPVKVAGVCTPNQCN